MIGRFWNQIHPFRLLFADQPIRPGVPLSERRFRTIYEARSGEIVLYLQVKTKRATDITKFDIRFLEGSLPFPNPKNADSNKVKIISVNAPEWEEQVLKKCAGIPQDIRKKPDREGGMSVEFPEHLYFHWIVGQPLWVEVHARIDWRWRGRISFRSETDRRTAVRRRVRIREG